MAPVGSVAEPLQGQRAAVQVGLPRMVGDLGRAQPVAPEIDRRVQHGERLVLAGRNVAVSPGQRDEGRLALGERGAAVTAGTQHAERDAARQLQLHVPLRRGDLHRVITVAGVAPRAAGGPVVKLRAAVHDGLDPAADARRDPDQHADRTEISRSPVIIRPPPLVLDRADGQQVMHGHPPRRGLPGRLQHHRPRHVPAMLGHICVAGTEPEQAGGTVEERAEDTRGIGSRQAQPLHRPVRRDQAALLAIRQEPVIGNRREQAHRRRTFASHHATSRH